MTTNPVEFLTDTIPALFNDTFAAVRAQAERGDAEAAQKLTELKNAAPLAVRVVLEGKKAKNWFVVFENGAVRTREESPSSPTLFAISVAEEALEIALEDFAEELARGFAKLKARLPQLAPLRARSGIERVAQEQLFFHYVVKNTPDFDEVRVKVALGGAEPPEKPTFTVTVEHEVIEQLRAKTLKPQNLLSKVQLTGDASRAMQWAMQMMQRRSQ